MCVKIWRPNSQTLVELLCPWRVSLRMSRCANSTKIGIKTEIFIFIALSLSPAI
jgi:hypothetical protein